MNEDFTGNLLKAAANNQVIRTRHQGGIKDTRLKKDYFGQLIISVQLRNLGEHWMVGSIVTLLLLSSKWC